MTTTQTYQYNLTEQEVAVIKQVLGKEPIGYEVIQDFCSNSTVGRSHTIVRRKMNMIDPYSNTTAAGIIYNY